MSKVLLDMDGRPWEWCPASLIPDWRPASERSHICWCDKDPGHRGAHHCPVCTVMWTPGQGPIGPSPHLEGR